MGRINKPSGSKDRLWSTDDDLDDGIRLLKQSYVPRDDSQAEDGLKMNCENLISGEEQVSPNTTESKPVFPNEGDGQSEDDLKINCENLISGEEQVSLNTEFEPVCPNEGNEDSFEQGKVPGKSIYVLNDINQNLFKVEISINNVPLIGIIDTGAARSLISSDIVKANKFETFDHTEYFKAVGDEKFETFGMVSCEISMGKINMGTTKIVVFPHHLNNNVSVLLGMDFLRANSLEINVKDRIIFRHHEGGGKTEIHVNNLGSITIVATTNIPCYVTQDLRMEPGKVQRVQVSSSNLDIEDSDMLLYSDNGMDSRVSDIVRGYEGITNQKTNQIFMLTNEVVTLKKGYQIGVLNSVLEVDCDEGEPEGMQGGLVNDFDVSHLDTVCQAKVSDMLSKHGNVFSFHENDIGLAGVTKHRIHLNDETPIYQRPRRFPKPLNDEIEKQCAELTAADIIEPSSSAWSSPIVPVRKKDGSVRLCIDYRKLNAVTVPDKFPVPNLSDSIFGLSGTKFFSRLDLVRGYYQVPLDEGSKQYTAFSTNRNHWQFKRLSFGLRNAPSAFQREIQAVLSSFPSNKVVAYIDDILIMSATFEEHVSLVSKVLQTLENYHIKIKASKCEWFQSEVQFLGHIVGSTGIRKTPEYMERISNYPKPKTHGELREFLGFVNFQRKYIPQCSTIQKPLSSLTGGAKNKLLDWTVEMTESFETLKREMKTELELGYPDYSEGANKLELYVDASDCGAGAYLAQQQGEDHRIIGFASMTFTSAQRHYCPLDRELAALRWGIKTFKPFLYGVEFILFTDHQPLVHLYNMKLINNRLARTVQELSDFIFEIRYIPGKLNCAADALSRLNYKIPDLPKLNQSYELPPGLVPDGPPSPGGGDSLFVSLYKSLTSINICRLPATVDGLRAQLVGDLVNQSDKYNLKLDRESRKSLKLMQYPGQLPSLDILLAACRLYQIKIYVYFWSETPVIYQYSDNDEAVVHLQCISGVHFNPLCEVKNYKSPDPSVCVVNSVVRVKEVDVTATKSCRLSETDSGIDNLEYCSSLSDVLCNNINNCNHVMGSLPVIRVTVGENRPCALVDSGAEISLVTEGALDCILREMIVHVVDRDLCELVGFSGKRYRVTQIVELKLQVGTYSMSESHQFAIIPSDFLPYCFLFGMDFLEKYNFSVDLHNSCCKVNSMSIPFQAESIGRCLGSAVMTCTVRDSGSHRLLPTIANGDLRFEIQGQNGTITGLSLLTESDVIRQIQRRNGEMKTLYRVLRDNLPCKEWPSNVTEYRRYAKKLSIVDNVIVFNECNVIVVPSKIVVELAVAVHFNFSHIGRDKLMSLLFDLVWHPRKTKIISDVCTTCHTCQLYKDFSTPVIPPRIKISTSYPFELLAADCMSLPTTSSGYVACLVVTDHYSKFVSVVPLKNKRSATVIDAFSRTILPFLPCVPTTILTDNGPEFISGEFNTFLDDCNIKHKLTTPGCPTSNGAVERVNRTIQNFIKTITTETNRWDEHLGRALITYNNTTHVELQMSPSKFLITKSHQHSVDPPLQSDLREYWKLGHPKFMPFCVNDLVLMKTTLKGSLNINKFLPKYDGPYKVGRVDSYGVTYQIIRLADDKILRAHHSKLRFYKACPSYISTNRVFKDYANRERDNLGGEEDEVIVEQSELFDQSFSSSTPDGKGGEWGENSSSDSSFSEPTKVCREYPLSKHSVSVTRSTESNISNFILNSYECKSLESCVVCILEDSLEKEALVDFPGSGSLGENSENLSDMSRQLELVLSDSSKSCVDQVYRFTTLSNIEAVSGVDEDCDGQPDGQAFSSCGAFSNNIDDDNVIGSLSSSRVIDDLNEEIESNNIIECYVSSNEDSDSEIVVENPCDPVMARELVENRLTQIVEADMIHNALDVEFGGFEVGDPVLSTWNNNRVVLNRIRESANVTHKLPTNAESSTRWRNDNFRHTRSKGSVEDLANVQPWTLERKRNRRLSS